MSKERQNAPTLQGIRDDHKERYRIAIDWGLRHNVKDVLDVGCGVGYGSFMMSKKFRHITAFDQSEEAIEFAKKHYKRRNVTHHLAKIEKYNLNYTFDLITAFEILEHTNSAGLFLRSIQQRASYLVGSVPNQDVVPFNKELHHYHVRHYTKKEIREFLGDNGWQIIKIGGQPGKHKEQAKINWSSCENGRTLVFIAEAMV